MNVEAFLKELKVKELEENLKSLNEEVSDYENKKNIIISNYVDYVYSVIKKSSFEKVLVILQYLNNLCSTVYNCLLEKKDKRIYRVALLIERLSGFNVEEIKKSTVDDIAEMALLVVSKGNFQLNKLEYFKRKYKLLKEYLDGEKEGKVSKKLDKDLKKFVKKIHNIEQVLFFNASSKDSLPDVRMIISSLFLKSNLDMGALNKIYSNVVLKNKYLKSFSCDCLIDKNCICNIKGLFKKCDVDFLRLFYDESENELNSLLKKIIETNKDDEMGLRWFFLKINSNISEELRGFLSRQDYYQYYTNISLDELYDENIRKLLNGDKDVDLIFLESLGSYKGFLDKYDLFLEKFYNSNDNEYEKMLLMPLTVGLMGKLKEKHNLNFQIRTSVSSVNNNTLGYYAVEENIMYVNPFVFENYEDKKEAFAMSVITIFHETRHVLQHKEIDNQSDFSYENLLITMDVLLREKLDVFGYYKKNYSIVSFEQDARDVAYVEAMKFFKGNDVMQKYVKEEDNKHYALTNFARIGYDARYIGIIDLFLEEFKCDLNLFNEYPIIQEFFEIDEVKQRIVPRNDEYFMIKQKELETMPDSVEKREKLYSIKMFQFALKTGKYLNEMAAEKSQSSHGFKKTDEDVLEQAMVENLGKMPTRR